MTRNSPRSLALRTFMALTPALLVTGVAVALVGGTRATEAAADAVSTGPSASAVSADPAASAGPAEPAASAVPDGGSSPACLTDDLAGTVTGRSGSGARQAVLSLTNTSGHACEIRGWADVALVTPPGEVVHVPTLKIGSAGPAIVLAPDATAWSVLQWDVCEAARTGCGVGVGLQYIADPDSTGIAADLAELPEADRSGITMKALRVGPYQSTRAAALA
ncbi:DUF4232 domain-containing protein [Actinoplanes sp. CA-252034]|uniref:DUF4232 domain-containing protein n=1 Tax=Actinoplanes sp. CA-252034 TaxID=3239906 RepID=UPI003D95EF3F